MVGSVAAGRGVLVPSEEALVPAVAPVGEVAACRGALLRAMRGARRLRGRTKSPRREVPRARETRRAAGVPGVALGESVARPLVAWGLAATTCAAGRTARPPLVVCPLGTGEACVAPPVARTRPASDRQAGVRVAVPDAKVGVATPSIAARTLEAAFLSASPTLVAGAVRAA